MKEPPQKNFAEAQVFKRDKGSRDQASVFLLDATPMLPTR